MVEHAITKWMWFKSKNLDAHELNRTRYTIVDKLDNSEFYINADTCSLCVAFDGCKGCTLKKYLNDTCDAEYDEYAMNSDPKPMINLLQSTLKMLKHSN